MINVYYNILNDIVINIIEDGNMCSIIYNNLNKKWCICDIRDPNQLINNGFGKVYNKQKSNNIICEAFDSISNKFKKISNDIVIQNIIE